MILFSQIINTRVQYGACYQEADPTSEHIFDQIATDGGFISIPEMGQVLRMIPLQDQLVILAKNGVWSIQAEGGIFSPTSYTVNKVTDVGVIGPDAVVDVEGTIMYWSDSGIYQLQLNEISQAASSGDITIGSIKTFYNEISDDAKARAKGYYDSIRKRVGWLYMNDGTWNFTNFPNHTNSELIFDVQLGAFLKHSHSSKAVDSPYVVGAVLGQESNTTQENNLVVVNGDQVQVNGDDVNEVIDNTITTNTKLKYLTFVPASGLVSFTLSNLADTTFKDWVTENYVSYFQTGWLSFNDWVRNKGIPYLVLHFNRTESGFDGNMDPLTPSSCLVQARWEWTDGASSGRWGSSFQAYRYRRPYVPASAGDTFDTGHTVITTRNKIRGRGKAVSFYMQSEPGKDMQLLGFGLTASGGNII
jgi:hypothetical protein